ncbi:MULTISPECIES: glutathione S-transferase [unclassified Bradyrhizobium]|uniref:glutathione S-transferase n=1 Tax=unclassified Bradyrhizobium TaxID=2631580 RepID=UPI001FF3DD1D|nr:MULTISPECIES: glutathione S-transferase [unclassified Bradyrhizobium]MCJ9699872.1 glutathione S-transferase [Bradyrhizobium sp. SHOUNA76]MCJ9728893.1 glutathione S-transferase [Bradyrhizobium sp. PRIMUS42]
MADLRIFSYLPNPRVWKATIAGRFAGVEIEIKGALAKELKSWLWDYNAAPVASYEWHAYSPLARTGRVGLTGERLFKTEAFMDAHPFGNVPAAFAPGGKIGIFESNSIMRAVARLSKTDFPLYGQDAYEASRIDSFLDVSLIFARDAQIYLLALSDGTLDATVHARAQEAFSIYASGLEQALSSASQVLVGDNISLADICFATEFALFMNEHSRRRQLEEMGLSRILHRGVRNEYPRMMRHFGRLLKHENFSADLGSYVDKLSAAAA